MAALFILMIFIWLVVMAYLAVGHVAQHGLPRRSERPQQPEPAPDRAQRLSTARCEFEEELRLLQSLELTESERTAAVLHARQKYTHRIKEILG